MGASGLVEERDARSREAAARHGLFGRSPPSLAPLPIAFGRAYSVGGRPEINQKAKLMSQISLEKPFDL